MRYNFIVMVMKIFKNKKLIYAVGIILFLAIVGMYVYLTWPHKIQQEMNGIEYSQEDKTLCQPVSVKIDGTMKQDLTGNRIFTGTIELLKTDLLLPDQKLTLSFDKVDWSNLSFRDLEGKYFDYGEMFADEEMSKVVIVEPDTGQTAGTSKAGSILAFPAEDRAEAETVTRSYFQQEKIYHFGIEN